VPVYRDITAFSLAHGFCDRPLLPRVQVPPAEEQAMRARLADLPRPLIAFGIGSSEPEKQWGQAGFSALADALIRRGCGVLLLGGPGEQTLADGIVAGVAPERRDALQPLCRETVIASAAALRDADACVSNDTGVANLAAACERPCQVLLGPRPLLDHDPLMRLIRSARLSDITPHQVLDALQRDGLIGPEAGHG
jgi:heptosyltransferase-2